MKTTLEILKEAYELIKDPARWAQTFDAKNAEGRAVDALDPEAIAWCAVGAMDKAMGVCETLPDVDGWSALNKAARELFGDRLLVQGCAEPLVTSPATVNDYLGHDAVLQMYGTAIMRLELEKANE